jgi:hypothetical protein
MKIKHKNSGEIFEQFPYYTKLNGVYGYLDLNIELKVAFFRLDYQNINCLGETVEMCWEDVSDDFEIIIDDEEMIISLLYQKILNK